MRHGVEIFTTLIRRAFALYGRIPIRNIIQTSARTLENYAPVIVVAIDFSRFQASLCLFSLKMLAIANKKL